MSEEKKAFSKTVATGLAGTTGLYVAQIFLQLGLTAAMARLLYPREFGVVSAAMVFITFARLFSEVGISQAIVQLPALNDRLLQVAQGVVLVTSIVFFGVTQLVAPLVADWFRQPELENVIRVLALLFVIQSQSLVPVNYLYRQMRASTVTFNLLLATFVGDGLVAIPLAALGFSYWSLIAGELVQEVTMALLLFRVVQIPRLPAFSFSESIRLLEKSLGFTMGKFFAFFANNGDNIIVGRYMSVAALGIYARAFYLANLPGTIYGTVVDRVVFPAIARVQHEPVRVRTAFLRGILLTSLVGLPLEVAAIILAPEVVRLFLGAHWIAVTVPFQILCAGLYPRLGYRVNGSLQRGIGSVRTLAWLQFLAAFLTFVTSYALYPFGISAVAAGIAGSVIFNWFVSTTFCCWVTGVTPGDFLRQHLHGFASSILLAAVLLACRAGAAHFVWSYWQMLLISAMAVCVVCGPFVYFFPRIFVGREGMRFLTHLLEPVQRGLRAREQEES